MDPCLVARPREADLTAIAHALDEKVLVLNRYYTAIRVISARRAFTMLCKRIAEVIAVEDGRYANYDLPSSHPTSPSGLGSLGLCLID